MENCEKHYLNFWLQFSNINFFPIDLCWNYQTFTSDALVSLLSIVITDKSSVPISQWHRSYIC